MELENYQKDILKVIGKTFPFTFSDVKYVFEKVKSFDATIAILKVSIAEAKSVYDIIDELPPNPSRFLGPQKITSIMLV